MVEEEVAVQQVASAVAKLQPLIRPVLPQREAETQTNSE